MNEKIKEDIMNNIENLSDESLKLLNNFIKSLQHPNELDKKNLTIPRWLNILAISAGINFSEVLRNGLLKELGIESLPNSFNDEINIKGSKFKKIDN